MFSFVLGNHKGSLNPDESFAFFGSNWPIKHLVLESLVVVGAVAVFSTANMLVMQV